MKVGLKDGYLTLLVTVITQDRYLIALLCLLLFTMAIAIYIVAL